jgi:hypothetical protein
MNNGRDNHIKNILDQVGVCRVQAGEIFCRGGYFAKIALWLIYSLEKRSLKVNVLQYEVSNKGMDFYVLHGTGTPNVTKFTDEKR